MKIETFYSIVAVMLLFFGMLHFLYVSSTETVITVQERQVEINQSIIAEIEEC